MAKRKADQEELKIIPSAGVERAKDGAITSFKDPAGRRFKARSPGGAIDKFLKTEKAGLRIDEVDLREVDTSEGAAVVRRRYQQELNGLRLLGAELKVVADKKRNSVISADNTLDTKVKRAPKPESARPFENIEAGILEPFASDYGSASVTDSSLGYLRFGERPVLPEAD